MHFGERKGKALVRVLEKFYYVFFFNIVQENCGNFIVISIYIYIDNLFLYVRMFSKLF